MASIIWRDILANRPGMTDEQAKEAALILSKCRCDMLYRCNNRSDKDYPRYGGRGIKVCAEWSDPVEGTHNFALWAIRNGWKPGLTIDRRDNNHNYSPDNCRWSTRAEQAYNRESNMSISIDVPVKILMDMLKLNGTKFRELLSEGKTAIEERLVYVRSKELDRTRDRKKRLYKGCCPCCGEQSERLYRSKAGNGKWVVIGCPSCVKTNDTYAVAVEAGVFDM